VIDKLEALVIFGSIRIKSNEHRIACGIDAERSQMSAELSKRTVLDRWTIVDFNVVIANPHWFCSSWFNAKILKFYFDSQATLNYNLVHAVGIFGVVISGKAW